MKNFSICVWRMNVLSTNKIFIKLEFQHCTENIGVHLTLILQAVNRQRCTHHQEQTFVCFRIHFMKCPSIATFRKIEGNAANIKATTFYTQMNFEVRKWRTYYLFSMPKVIYLQTIFLIISLNGMVWILQDRCSFHSMLRAKSINALNV